MGYQQLRRGSHPHIILVGLLALLLQLAPEQATAQPGQLNTRWKGQNCIELAWDTTAGGVIWKIDTTCLHAHLAALLDSLAGTISTSSVRGEVHITATANFSNQANDSTNLQLGGLVYTTYALPYDMYVDRFILRTNEPDSRGPSTFRTDLPRISTDSVFVARLSRNSSFTSGQRAALTIYKVPRSSALSVAHTAGTFYDMIRFDEVVFPPTGTSTAVYITLVMRKDP